MKNSVAVFIFAILVMGLFPTAFIFAQKSSLDTIQALQQQIVELQKQITDLQAQLETVKKTGVPVTENIIFTKILQRGTKDDEVRQLQEFLKQFFDIYPEGLVTGYFGTLTEAAVKRLQEKHGIEPIGIVGPKTRQKLNELISDQPSLAPQPAEPIKPKEPVKSDTSTTSTPIPTSVLNPISTPISIPTSTPNLKPMETKCWDGTPYSQCSSDKPKWCLDGNLADNCVKCGCPIGYKCQSARNCQKIEVVCSDGTANNTCTFVKPYFCNNGQLVADCNRCGCVSAAGSQCSASGECSPSCLAIQYSGDPADKLDIVFVPDKLTAAELPYFSNIAVPVYAGLIGKNGILKHEPFASSKQKINIWVLAVAEDFGCDWPWCHAEPSVNWTGEQRQGHEKLMAALGTCPGRDEVIIIRTSSRSAHSGDSVQGSGYAYINYSRPASYDNWTEAQLNSWLNIWDNAANTAVHELAHSFGRIGDEYAFNLSSLLPEDMISSACDQAGCPQWCSGAYKMSYNEYASGCAQFVAQETCEVAECVWIPKFTSVYSQPNSYYGSCIARRSDKDNGIGCLANSGCFQGCGGIANWWRSAASSIMTGANPPSTFSGWHIKLLQDRLSKYR